MILDAATIAELKSDGPDSFAEIVTLFVEDTALRFAQLKDARARGDAGAVKDIAHALKGASGAVGALRMRELCAGIQESAKGSLETVEGPIRELEAEYDRVCDALKKEKSVPTG